MANLDIRILKLIDRVELSNYLQTIMCSLSFFSSSLYLKPFYSACMDIAMIVIMYLLSLVLSASVAF